MKDWKVVNEQIKKSKIERFPWKSILGMSLTKAIKLNRVSKGSLKR